MLIVEKSLVAKRMNSVSEHATAERGTKMIYCNEGTNHKVKKKKETAIDFLLSRPEIYHLPSKTKMKRLLKKQEKAHSWTISV